MNYQIFPPEINALRLFTGAGSAPLLEAAAAWNGLAAELGSAAESFASVTTGLAGQAWQGPAAQAMSAAASPYAGWLSAAAARAADAAGQANAVASVFETARATMVHPLAVAANRNQFIQLVLTNIFGQNAPAIAAAEATYEEMWASAVSTMAGYHGGAAAAVSQLPSWQAALESLPSLPGQVAGAVTAAVGGNGSPVQALLSAPAKALSAAAAPGSPLQQLEAAQVSFNSNLVNGEMAFNQSLVTNEVAFEKAVFGSDSAFNGALNRGFNVGNLLLGSGQQAVNSFFGAQVPSNFTSGLLLGGPGQVFNGGQIGGPVGAFDQSLALGADVAGAFVGNGPAQSLLAAVGLPAQAPAINGFLHQIEAAQLGFNTNLIGNELAFNQNLLANEVGFERAVFGSDSALNGAVNRGFNVGNLLFGTGEQAVNTFFGAHTPADFISTLLQGGPAQTFNGGQIGGPVGAFDQSLAFGADLAGSVAAPQTLLSAPAQALSAAAAAPGSPLQQLEAAQVAFNTNLTHNELAFNQSLVGNEVGFERAIFGTDSALNGAVNRGFNIGNLLVGSGEQAVNTFFGAQVPPTSSLLLGSAAQVFNGGQIGGPVGAFDQGLALGADVAGAFVGNGPAQSLLAAVGLPAQAPAINGFLHQIETAQIGFNTNLIGNELAFNQNLLTNEVGFEQAFFGTDSAFNGAVNRGFNVGNLLFGTGEQAVNTFFGAQAPADFTATLLQGGPAQPFNGGQIGGPVGAFGQALAFGADVVGLLTGA
ncbi:PPE family protein [Mycobacterium kubicae]|uniref:PPE family protein n=1 Tax=Mycobacterium kubicae TaxID=120959 RepID=UPI0007FD6CF4|nr:PPE family protein [Mycobacterium kubicae]OBK49953.1 hypothetical protein A5657_21105 [Mycobacterium kubicae]